MRNRLIFQTVLGVILLTMVFSITSIAQTSGVYIKGMVTSRTGRPLSSVWVIVSQDGTEKGRALTGDDGKYYISNLSDGGYKLMVYRDDRQLYEGEVNLPGDSRHDISIR